MDSVVIALNVFALGALFLSQAVIMSGLDNIRDNQAALKAKVEALIVLVQNAAPEAFTPDQQAEIDAIVASQVDTLAEQPVSPPPTTGQ